MILPRDRYNKYRKSIFDGFRLSSVSKLRSGDEEEVKRITEVSIPNRYEEFEDVILKSSYPQEEDFERYVLERCKAGDPLALILFCKNPSRASKDEETQFDFIDSRFSDILFKYGKFEKIGIKRIYYIDKKFTTIPKGKKPKDLDDIHSLDFSIKYTILGKTFTGVGTLKRADDKSKKEKKGSGGTQRYQIKDVENTNKEFIKSSDKNLYTFSIVGGNCFSKDEYEYLFKTYRTERNKISSVDKFGVVLIGSILHWLRESFDGSALPTKEADIISEEIARLQSLLELYKFNLSK